MLRFTEKSLQEQMGLNEKQVKRRLHLLNVTGKDIELVRSAAPVIDSVTEEVIEKFYSIQVEDTEVAAVIGDIDTLKRLRGLMTNYVRSLFGANHDETYVNSRLRIGKVHKRLDVTPKLFITAQTLLQSLLEKQLDLSLNENSAAVIASLKKLFLFDTELVFEAYIDSYIVDAEAAQNTVDKYALDLGIHVNNLTKHENSYFRDGLTGIYNRQSFYEYLERECSVARRYSLPLTLVYFDLNSFKPINDCYGHVAGDRVLSQVGQSLLSVVRAVDIAARYGGDEFCIIMPRTTADQVDRPIDQLIKVFSETCEHPITFSFGVAQTGPQTFVDPDELILKADRKMYVAKQRAKADGQFHIER